MLKQTSFMNTIVFLKMVTTNILRLFEHGYMCIQIVKLQYVATLSDLRQCNLCMSYLGHREIQQKKCSSLPDCYRFQYSLTQAQRIFVQLVQQADVRHQKANIVVLSLLRNLQGKYRVLRLHGLFQVVLTTCTFYVRACIPV